jgi:hypothetical protein
MNKIKVAQLEMLKIKLIYSYDYLRDVSFAHVNILKSNSLFFGVCFITFIIPK